MPHTPSEDELKTVLEELRNAHPDLGMGKLHSLLLSENPDWSVSEKRMKKILTQLGMGPKPGPSTNPGNKNDEPINIQLYPTSKLNETLKLEQWSNKIRVEHFGKKKGKGLVATQVIEQGEEIWKEDPFIIAPELDIWDAQLASAACAYCTTPLIPPSPLHKECLFTRSGCAAKFCSALCLKRSAVVHPLLCIGSNPTILPFLQWIRKIEWQAPHALAHTIARVILAHEKGAESQDYTQAKNLTNALAEMSLEQRNHDIGATPDHKAWRETWNLLVAGLKTPIDNKKLSKFVKKPLSEDVAPELFDYDAFLRGLGKMSLNREYHGGLYALHSHINHSCNPNISVRHLHQRVALARITVLAKRRIEPNEELTITYVNPELGVVARRRTLRGWNWGECDCARCVEEAAQLSEKVANGGDITDLIENGGASALDVNDLEKELREGLGLNIL